MSAAALLLSFVVLSCVDVTRAVGARLANNGTVLYTVAQNQLFRSDTLPQLVFGANDLTALLATDDERVWAATLSCVLNIQLGIAHRWAGSVLEAGTRDGPLLYARFSRLVAIASTPSFLLVVDAGRPDQNILYLNDWYARPLLSEPDALALSTLQSWLLVLTPTYAAVWVMQASVPALSAQRHTNITSPTDASWTTGAIYDEPAIYLYDSAFTLWIWRFQDSSAASLASSTLLLTTLLPGGWAFLAPSSFFVVQTNDHHDVNRTFTLINSYSTWPLYDEAKRRMACPSGYLYLVPYCVQAPGGGYAVEGVFHPCPAGTYGPLPMATSLAACIPCPPATVAPTLSSAVCSHCSRLTPWQSANGSVCLSSCPDYNPPFQVQHKCASCAVGFFATPSGVCAPCSNHSYDPNNANMVTWSDGTGPCLPCTTSSCAAYAASYCTSPSAHVFTLLSPPLLRITSVAAALNGTLYLLADQALWLLYTDHSMQKIGDPPADAFSLVLSPDESVVYILSSAALCRRTPTRPSSFDQTILMLTAARAMCCTATSLFVLDADSIWQATHEAPQLWTLFFNASSFWIHTITTQPDMVVLALIHTGGVAQLMALPSQQILVPVFPFTDAPWILRISAFATLVFTEYALMVWPDDATAGVVLAGSLSGSLDNEAHLARFVRVTSASPLRVPRTNNSALLLVDDNHQLRMLYTRGCQCPPNTRMQLFGDTFLCIPCAPFTHAMAGAVACTACLQGQYLNAEGLCTPCPEAYWWYDPLMRACAPLQDTSATPPAFYFRELQAVAPYYAALSDDFVCSLRLYTPLPHFATTDVLGRLWVPTPSPFPSASSTLQCVPGLWVLCAAPTDQACNCSYPFPPSFANSPWTLFPGIHYAYRANSNRAQHVLLPTTADYLVLEPPLTGDTGRCYMGWPARCRCADPSYYWSLDQFACIPCPPDTAVPTWSWECCPISDTTNLLCLEGQYYYAPASTNASCLPCPPHTYSSVNMASACLAKQVRACPALFYLYETGPTRENECSPCLPCDSATEIMVPPDEPLCSDPNATHPSYVCIPWAQPIPAFAVALGAWNADQPTLRLLPCPTSPPFASQWVAGPSFALCYFACLYGVTAAQEEYYFHYNNHNNNEPTTDNLFPYPLLSASPALLLAADKVCMACNTTACDGNLWRPLWTTTCGPPCMLYASRCPNNLGGCIPPCQIPANAHFTDTSTCVWRCNVGWFRINQTACVPCAASSCGLGESYSSFACYDDNRYALFICTPCGPNRPIHLAPGICRESCPDHHFPSATAACVLCAANADSYYCAPGSSALCAPTACTACALPPPDNAVYVPTNDTVCRVQCKAGYHTVWLPTGEVLALDYEQAWDPAHIQCEECGLRSSALYECPLTSCPPTETIVHVANRLECIPCQSSYAMGCALGTYAPCQSGVVPQQHCVLCPPLQTGHMYIAYTPTSTTMCPTACPPNTIQHGIQCVSCNLLYSAPALAPYQAFYARWDAPPWPRWWPVQFDPPHLGLRDAPDAQGNPVPEPRAGRCWPCPSTVAANANDPFLCLLTQNSNVQLWPAHDTMNGTILELPPTRRLLAHNACPPGSFPQSQGLCALCPPQHWCIGIEPPQRCPPFTTAQHPGSSQCATCVAGFVPNGTQCILPQQTLPPAAQAFACPSTHVISMLSSGIPACSQCPPGMVPEDKHTCAPLLIPPLQCPPTWSLLPFGECACGPGTYPSTTCIQCAKGTFSAYLGHAACTPCPANTTTLSVGSTRLADCSLPLL